MIDLSAIVAYLTAVLVVGAVGSLIVFSRRHPAASQPVGKLDRHRRGNMEKPQPIRPVVADDHPIVREGLRRLLEAKTNYKVIGEASDGTEAVRLARQLKPDILTMALRMRGQKGLEALRELSSAANAAPVRVILLTAHIEKSQIVEALQLGARGSCSRTLRLNYL